MKVKYETDPDFTAEDFHLSLKPDKVLAGQNEMWKTYKKSGLEKHLIDVIDSNYDVDADDYKASDPDMYSKEFREARAKNAEAKENAQNLMEEFGYKKDGLGKLEKHIEYKDARNPDVIYDLSGDINDDVSNDMSDEDDLIINTSSKPKQTKKKKKRDDPDALSNRDLDRYVKQMFTPKVKIDQLNINEYINFSEKKLRGLYKTYEDNLEDYKNRILTDSDKKIFRQIAERKVNDAVNDWDNQKAAFMKSISDPPEFMKHFEQMVRENPSNVKLNEREVIKYRDFALAKCSRSKGAEDKATNELYKKLGADPAACEKKLASAEKLQKTIMGKI